MQPFFNVALVEVAALTVGGDNAPQHHALYAAQLGGDLRRNAGVQGAADGAGNLGHQGADVFCLAVGCGIWLVAR